MPTISVILPVYNGEKTIRETILSILNQTFTDFELIIINDGSHDQTLAVIEQISTEFNETRLAISSYPNAGLASSRNRGINLSKGEYIAFIDADDLWINDKLETQLNLLVAHPRTALAYSWTDFIDEQGHYLHAGSHESWSGNVYEKLLTFHFLESGSNALTRKSVLAEVGGFDESLMAAEDWDLHLKIAAHYDFVVVPKVQILYRQTASSMSASVLKQERESLKVLIRAFQAAPAALQKLKRQSLANLYQYLTFKAIANCTSRSQALLASRCLYQAVINDPRFIRRRFQLFSILIGKITIYVLFPPAQAQKALAQLSRRGC